MAQRAARVLARSCVVVSSAPQSSVAVAMAAFFAPEASRCRVLWKEKLPLCDSYNSASSAAVAVML